MKKIIAIITAMMIACTMVSCTEAERVSYNISEEADNFNVFRRLVVMNMRSDKIIFEFDGYFSIYVDSTDNQLEVTCETAEGKYKKHFIGLNDWVAYTVEDINGADVDKYHYEVHYLPEGNVVNFRFKKSQ